MGYGRYVGRAGALAVVLGVGAAVASSPALASTESDTASASKPAHADRGSGADGPAAGAPSGTERSPESGSSQDRSGSSDNAETDSDEAVTAHRSGRQRDASVDVDEDEEERTEVSADGDDADGNSPAVDNRPPGKPAATRVTEPPAPSVEPQQADVPSTATPAVTARTVTTRPLTTLSPASTTPEPVTPTESPLLLAFLAAARRVGVQAETRPATASAASALEIFRPGPEVVTSVRVGEYLHGLVVTPDGRRIYIADMDNGTVRVINAANGRPAAGAIKVGEGPYGVAITPDGKRVFVTVNAQSIVRVIDTATNRVIGEPIAVADDPRQLLVSPDGRRVYVSHDQGYGRGAAITVIDTATNKAVGSPISLGGSPGSMVMSADGQRLYVQTYNSGMETSQVVVVATSTGQTVGSPIPMNTGLIAISPDEKRFYSAAGENSVYVVDAATGAVIGDPIAVQANWPSSGVLSPDGTRLYVYGYSSDWGMVSVVDTATFTELGAGEIASWPGELVVSRDGRRLYTTGTNGTVTVIDTAKLERKNSAPTVTLQRQGAPSSSGRVTGSLTAKDGDGDRLSYTGMTTSKGTVTVTSRGSFTYTPTAAARHAAAAAGAPAEAKTDTFTITVNDGKGGVATVPITVAIRPANSAPSSVRATVAKPDQVTGVVTGRVSATDRDRDTLTYSAPVLASGTVTFRADGTFTYVPSDAAREKARATRGTDTERFKVTVNDGHGGIKTVTVSVTIAPQSAASRQGPTATGGVTSNPVMRPDAPARPVGEVPFAG